MSLPASADVTAIMSTRRFRTSTYFVLYQHVEKLAYGTHLSPRLLNLATARLELSVIKLSRDIWGHESFVALPCRLHREHEFQLEILRAGESVDQFSILMDDSILTLRLKSNGR